MSPRRPPEIGPDEGAQLEQARRRRMARTVGVLAFAVVAVAFVVENAQTVKVRFWFVTAHPRLIYVVVACLVVGTLVGLALSRQVRRRRSNRRGLFHRRAA